MISHEKDSSFLKSQLVGLKILVYLLFLAGIVVSLVGCTRTSPTPGITPEQVVMATFLPKHFLPLIFAQGEAESSVQATPEPGQPSATVINIPISTDTPMSSTDTPTPCAPPTDWVVYTVQPGDTLFSLAQKTNTTVDEIQSANCMEGATTIIVGQALYLPILPPTNTPVPPTNTHLPPTSTFTPEPEPPTPTDTPDRPDIVFAPGGGNNPDFTPCDLEVGSPWIDVDDDHIAIGERRYFFACEFENEVVSANVTMSNGQVVNMKVLTTMPNPILQQGSATALVVWSALPMHPASQTGELYSLTFADSTGNDFTRTFWIESTLKESILAVPPVDSAGSTFEIYYINFDYQSTLTIDLYHEKAFQNNKYTFGYLRSWEITITNSFGLSGKGWEAKSLISGSTDPLLAYLVGHELNPNELFCNACTLYWLR